MKIWHERIQEARVRGAFTDEDRILSANWPDCACGKCDPRIPRRVARFDGDPYAGMPIDPELMILGSDFYHFVRAYRLDLAEEALYKIEARAAEILYQLETVTP